MKFKTPALMLALVLFCNCSNESIVTDENDDNSIVIMKVKDIVGGPDTHYYYEDDKIMKSSMLNRANYEVYQYNIENKITRIIRYEDNINFPNNSSELDFDNANNFNDNEYYTDYEWSNSKSFLRKGKQYNINDEGLLESVVCISSCESVNIYYSNGGVSQVLYNEGMSSQNIYTYEFDEGFNPMNVLFKEYGYVEYINIGVFDYFFDFYLPKNATKIYRNGELVFTANYEYNSFNYPIYVSFERLLTGERGEAVFTYLK